MNYVKTFLLMFGLILLCAFVGQLVGGPRGMMYGFVLAAVMNFGAYWFSDKVLLSMHRAVEVAPKDEPALFRAVQKLAQAGNLPMPKLYIIESESPNAFATGRNPAHAAVAVTRGIMEVLSPVELEAVIAHELSHVRHRDMLIGTLAATMAGAIMMIGRMAQWAAIFGGSSNRDDERGGNPLGFLLLVVVAPLAAFIIQMAISRSREYSADAGAAALTSNPAALARALKKIEAAAMQVPLESATPAASNLYIVNPFGRESWMVNMFSTHPSIGRRVKRLEAIQEGRIRPED
jgi:heat shock protein HtpX